MISEVTGLETEIKKAYSTLRAVGVESLTWALLQFYCPKTQVQGPAFQDVTKDKNVQMVSVASASRSLRLNLTRICPHTSEVMAAAMKGSHIETLLIYSKSA
jgi:hypothetical protein